MKTIATLPLSPRHKPTIGFYLIPFVGHILALLAKRSFSLAVNILGAKEGSAAAEEGFFNTLQYLGVQPDHLWRDAEHQQETLALFSRGYAEGWIRKTHAPIFICPCGKVEFLETEDNLVQGGFTRTTYELVSGAPRCTVCKGYALRETREALLLRIGAQPTRTQFFPAYARKEAAALERFFIGKELLVSRTRADCPEITLDGSAFRLDWDFFWMAFLPTLPAEMRDVEVLLTGHKTLKHAILASLVAMRAGIAPPQQVLATPYFDTMGKSSGSADELVASHPAEVLRTFLALGMGSERKDLTVNSSLLYLIAHSIRVPREELAHDMEWRSPLDAWRSMDTKRLQNALAELRRRNALKLSPGDKSVLQALIMMPQS